MASTSRPRRCALDRLACICSRMLQDMVTFQFLHDPRTQDTATLEVRCKSVPVPKSQARPKAKPKAAPKQAAAPKVAPAAPKKAARRGKK